MAPGRLPRSGGERTGKRLALAQVGRAGEGNALLSNPSLKKLRFLTYVTAEGHGATAAQAAQLQERFQLVDSMTYF